MTMVPELRAWTREEMMKRVAFFKDLKGSKGGVLSFAAILSLLATAAAGADNRPSNSTECAFSSAPQSAPIDDGHRPAPIADGHRLQPRACEFTAPNNLPDVSESDARVIDKLYRELMGHSATTPPSQPAENRR
jgi:hypothetical protein